MSRNFKAPAYVPPGKAGMIAPGAIPSPPDPMGGVADPPEVTPPTMQGVMPPPVASSPKMAPATAPPGPRPPPTQRPTSFGFSRPTLGYAPAKV